MALRGPASDAPRRAHRFDLSAPHPPCSDDEDARGPSPPPLVAAILGSMRLAAAEVPISAPPARAELNGEDNDNGMVAVGWNRCGQWDDDADSWQGWWQWQDRSRSWESADAWDRSGSSSDAWAGAAYDAGFLRVGADEAIDPEETRFLQLMDSIQPAFSVWVRTWSSGTGRYVTERNPYIPEFQPAEPCQGVLLGDLDDVHDVNGLVEKGVGSVICLCPEKVPDVGRLTELLRRTHSIDLVPIWADDDQQYDVLAHLPLVKETIDRDKQ